MRGSARSPRDFSPAAQLAEERREAFDVHRRVEVGKGLGDDEAVLQRVAASRRAPARGRRAPTIARRARGRCRRRRAAATVRPAA